MQKWITMMLPSIGLSVLVLPSSPAAARSRVAWTRSGLADEIPGDQITFSPAHGVTPR